MDSFDRESVTEFITEPGTPVNEFSAPPLNHLDGGSGEEWLLKGERVEGVARDVTYVWPASPLTTRGHLTLTNYRLLFNGAPPASDLQPPLDLHLPLGFISKIEKVGGQSSKGDNSYRLELQCKDLRTIKFALRQEQRRRKSVVEMVQQCAFPRSHGLPLFAFNYSEAFPENGWTVYDPLAELDRLGVPCDSWRLCHINRDYEVCDTYPKLLSVPSDLSDDEARAVAGFRSKGRLPVLSWLHPHSQAALVRCSQPSVGMAGRRSSQDEKYVSLLAAVNPHNKRVTIADARPSKNAIANKAKGGGYEAEEAYPSAEILFFDIHNIHIMRDSLRKLRKVCFPVVDESKWLSNVDSTYWLRHIKCVLGSACRIVDKMDSHRTSVMVHCSDGWDRTAQLTSLSMLMMDSYYRTIRGFQVLVEKEWISFGHKFQLRVGHGDENHSDDNRSPIFLQFLDCVWQMTLQFPNSFQFNETFLLTVLEHLYTCRFGTFLFNCEKERETERVREETVSLWSYINSDIDKYLNPLYLGHNSVLNLVASLRYLKPWTSVYCRYSVPSHPLQDEVYLASREQAGMKEQLEKMSDRQRRGGAARDESSPIVTSTPVRAVRN